VRSSPRQTRTEEYLAAVRADGDALVQETMFFADEIRDPRQEISNLPGSVDLSSREVQMASQLIEAMTGPWNPADYRDAYTDRVSELIEAKKNKKEFEPAVPAPAAADLTDLTQALQASLDAAGKPRAKKRSAEKPPGTGAAWLQPARCLHHKVWTIRLISPADRFAEM
jgi:DNA end-binding protein Ku